MKNKLYPICPQCENEVHQMCYIAYFNGDSLWRCETCDHYFKTDIAGNIKNAEELD